MLYQKIKTCYNRKREYGYVTLISVLVLGAVGVATTISIILLGLGSSRTNLAYEQSDQAKGLAIACAEEALQQIRDSTIFYGNGNLSFGQGTCSYGVTSAAGQNRIISASGIVGTIVRKVEITINGINPEIIVASWQEVAD